MAEYKLGNKALELYRYTLQVTRPVADDKVDAKDVAKVLRTIARADTIEEMRELLLKTADRLDKKPGRPRFPKSESFGMIADLRGAARNIVRGVHAANETIFIENPEERLKEIKAVIDECNLMLRLVALSNDLGYTDIKRVETWTNKILCVHLRYYTMPTRPPGRANAKNKGPPSTKQTRWPVRPGCPVCC